MPKFELRDKNGTLMNPPEIDFRLEDFVTVKDGSAVGAGFMSWQKGGFSWTLTYDEVDYVVEGIMEITYDGKTYAVPDNPVIPFLRGDGTGPDIWAASERVFDG